MGLPVEVLKAWEACDRIDTLFVLVCCVFCMSNPSGHSIREASIEGSKSIFQLHSLMWK
jgi:hypothetical protein